MAKSEQVIGLSDTFAFGTAFHALLLEPERFADRYEIWPEIEKPTSNAGKEEAERILEANPETLFLKSDAMGVLNAMASGALEHPAVQELLSQGGHAEVGFYGEKASAVRGGPMVRTKVRVDLVLGLDDPSADLVIVDLKTTRDASPAAFRESVIAYHYAAQQAWYVAEVEKVTGRRVSKFPFLVVEKSWPFHAGLYELGHGLRLTGEAEIGDAWQVWSECTAKDEWPGYGNGGVMVL